MFLKKHLYVIRILKILLVGSIMRFYIKLSIVLGLVFFSFGCSKNSNSDSNSPTPVKSTPSDPDSPSPTPNLPPQHASQISLATENAQLSPAGQSYILNYIKMDQSDLVETYYKKFQLVSKSRRYITMEYETSEFTHCQAMNEANYDVQLTADNVKQDLKQNKSFIAEPGIVYDINVRLGNPNHCTKVQYAFALVAQEISDNGNISPFKPDLPKQVVCRTKDETGRSQFIQFDLERNEVSLQYEGSTGTILVFDLGIACGFQPKNTAVKCENNMNYDGNIYSQKINCTAQKEETSKPYFLASGEFWFQLNNGDGKFNCQVFQTNKYLLKLTGCQAQP